MRSKYQFKHGLKGFLLILQLSLNFNHIKFQFCDVGKSNKLQGVASSLVKFAYFIDKNINENTGF